MFVPRDFGSFAHVPEDLCEEVCLVYHPRSVVAGEEYTASEREEEDTIWWSMSAWCVANEKLGGGAESAKNQWPGSNSG